MQKSFRLVVILALIGLAFGSWRFFFASPQRVIRSRLHDLAETATVESSDGNFVRLFKLQRIPDFFTPDVVVSCDIRGMQTITIEGRSEIEQYAKMAMNPQGGVHGLKTEFRDVSVALGKDRQSAIANLTAQFTFHGQQDFYVVEMNVMFKKIDGRWLIYRIATVKTLAHETAQPLALRS